MDRKRGSVKHFLRIAALLGPLGLVACGGGGGGGPTGDVAGTVYVVGAAALQGAVVTIGGRQTQTDVGGNFLMRSVPVNAGTLSITGSGIQPLTQPLAPLTPNARNDLGNIFVVASGGAYTADVQGTVVRSDTLQPVSGARVLLNGMVFVTGADGKFQFTKLPVGLGGGTIPVGLITLHDANGIPLLEDKPLLLDLPLGASPPVNDLGLIPMSPPVGSIPGGPYNIRGTVTLQGLTDYSGTTVTLIAKATGSTVQTFTTDASGGYGFWVVPGAYTVKAEHAGFTTQQADVTLTAPDQPVTHNFTLTP
ncbi:MAG: carboxypeptidase regulatory-like domain-containing protein [Chthonomonadales bacterium]